MPALRPSTLESPRRTEDVPRFGRCPRRVSGPGLHSVSLARAVHDVVSLGEIPLQCLDLSEVPPAAREKTGRAAAGALYGIWAGSAAASRRDPRRRSGQAVRRQGADSLDDPKTEIALVRAESGPRSGEFLFSAETVAGRASSTSGCAGCAISARYRSKTCTNRSHQRGLDGPVRVDSIVAGVAADPDPRPVGLEVDRLRLDPGRPRAVPVVHVPRVAARRPRAPVPAGIGAVRDAGLGPCRDTGGGLPCARPARLYRRRGQRDRARGHAVMFLAGAWMAWRLAPVVAEAIIASPSIAPESIDARLIRVVARLLGVVGGMACSPWAPTGWGCQCMESSPGSA